MNSNTEKAEDRFGDTGPFSKKTHQFRLFSPELLHRNDLAIKGFADFTIDKEYPVIQQDLISMKFKTVNDRGVDVWVADDYFIPAEINLYHDRELGFTKKETKLVWQDAATYENIPNVRKIQSAREQFVKEMTEETAEKIKCNAEAVKQRTDEKQQAVFDGVHFDAHKLAGVVTPNNNPWANEKLDKPEKIVLKSESSREEQKEKVEQLEKELTAKLCSGGEVRENNLLWDHERLWEKMGQVFSEYRKLDSDVVLGTISKSFPNRRVYWHNGYLNMDGAKTNISKADVDSTFDGLKKLTSPKAADKMVAKIVVKKLKKLF